MPDRELTVLWLSTRWPAEAFLMTTLRSLVARGVRIQVAVTEPYGASLESEPGVELIRQPSWDGPAVDRLRVFAVGAWSAMIHPRRLWRLVRARPRREGLRGLVVYAYRSLPLMSLEPDVVHFQWNTMAVELSHVPKLLGAPCVVSCRGSQINVAPHNPRRAAFRAGLAAAFAEADAVHCVSTAMQREAQIYGLDIEKSRVIHPAVDPSRFTPRTSARDTPNTLAIAMIGNLSWVKGYEYAVMALRTLHDNGVPATLEIAGDGNDRQRVEFAVNDLELQSVVRLAGSLDRDEIARLLQRSDVLLVSSLSEGLSNAALEAMATGLPIVTTDCGGMREAVEDGVHGLVVPTRDAAAIAAALKKLADDRVLSTEMGAAARQRIVDEFSIDRQCDEWLELYRSVATRRVGRTL